MYECGCDPYFSGKACQYDSRPCSSGPCLNNGTCVNINNDTSFQCECQQTFFGLNCENQINICQNKTCGGKGYCFNDQNEPKCKCFTGYSGDECETVSTFVKLVRPVVQISTSLICFIVIGTTIVLIISNDVWNYFMARYRKKYGKIIKSKKIIRFKYHN